ncbi:carbohydrate ABC transporter permease [Candidatus Sumerlaeota bacterium]|nr:carbohydrate ABC transporter permease [Candidatus Sumerlaeota bacterium]
MAQYYLKKKWRERIKIGVILLILLIGAIPFLMPLVWLISTSLKTTDQIFTYPPKWIPKPVAWRNYIEIFSYMPFLSYFKNTMIITVTTLIGVILSSSLIAYGFARIKFFGSKVLFMVLLSTIMLPPQVTMIPLYILFSKLKWVDTLLPLTVPYFFGNAFFVFLLKQFFHTIPVELEDAARIDGCTTLGIYWRIAMPLCKPALAAVAIFQFQFAWSDFMGPLIYLSSEEKKTLALGLQNFLTIHGGEWHLLMAASTLMILPVILVFFTAQRYFIRGVILSGLKG